MDKNHPKVSEKKLKELGILKVLQVSISDDKETEYRVVTTEGETKFVSASELEGKEE